MEREGEKIELWRWPGLAEPSDEFRWMVEEELRAARAGAYELLGVPDPKARVYVRGPYKMRRRREPGRCVGCGCLLDERTGGCANCTARHEMRKRAGRSPDGKRGDGRCSGCGCDVNERTKGCRTCKSRHGFRSFASRRSGGRPYRRPAQAVR